MADTDDFRARLGSRLVLWSSVALVILAIAIIIGAGVAERAGQKGSVMNAAQLLLSALLPLFGTWVGTILAFYYTKENFESANRGTLDIVKTFSQQLRSTKIADKMMPRAQMIVSVVAQGKTLKDLPISEIQQKFQQVRNGKQISRLPILDGTDIFVAMLHRSVFAEMLADGLRANPAVQPTSDTLGTLLSKPYPLRSGGTYEDFVKKTIAFVAQDRSLADAKAAMEQVQDCEDVIVTASGSSTEPTLGWISNVDIGRLSQA
jgi:hypothetical protein